MAPTPEEEVQEVKMRGYSLGWLKNLYAPRYW